MNKQQFLDRLRSGLSGLPHNDIEERLTFYSEMIDDRMEEGLSEEEAVSQIGSVESIISQIISESPFVKLVKETINPKKRHRGWETTLLVLGSPVWIPLLISAFAVVFSLFVTVWSLILSFWAVFISMIACALGVLVAGIGFILGGHTLTGVAVIGAAITCAGLSVFLFFGCKAATKGSGFLTKRSIFALKKCFIRKEEA